MRRPSPFGKYYLLDRVNVGGMAEVFRAKATGVEGFEKLVAIKRILPNIAEDDEFITMFIDEAKISVQLSHANIAQIYDLGKIDESYFIAMEFIAGKDLRTIFERARKRGEVLPVPMSCYVMARVCEGLDYAHRKKDAQGHDLHIVHRDVSPQNILVAYEGEVKLIDFGIAKAANKASKTQAGILKGKFGYMSPEQVRGLPIDRRSDVFAVGIVLYELLTGERLFVGESDFSTLEKVRNVEIMPPTTYNRRIPHELEQIVLRALSREPEERYQSAAEVQEDLSRLLASSGNIFSRRDLSAFMKIGFADDIHREEVALAQFRENSPAQPPSSFGSPRPPPLPAGSAPKPTLPSIMSGDDPAALLLPGADDDSATRVYDAREHMEQRAAPARPSPPPPVRPAPPPSAPPRPSSAPRSVTENTARVSEPPAPVAMAMPASEGSTDPIVVVPPLALDTGIASMPQRMPPRQSARRRKVLGAVTGLAVVVAAVVLFFYLRSVDGGRATRILVKSTPGARAKLCGGAGCKDLGVLDAQGRLEATHASGQFRLAVTRDGCEEGSAPATLVPNQDNEIRLGDLKCTAAAGVGVLRIATSPVGARVKFTRAELASWNGLTPYERQQVPPGAYDVELELEGHFSEKHTMTARPGAETRLDAKLVASAIKLAVESEPDGAKVVVREAGQEQAVAKAKRTPAVLTFTRREPSAKYEAVLTREGHKERIVAIVFAGQPEQKLTTTPVALEEDAKKSKATAKKKKKTKKEDDPDDGTPDVEDRTPGGEATTPSKRPPPVSTDPGTLNVNLKGAWAYVHIDGVNTGRTTPLIGHKLPAGRHRVTLVRDELGYHSEFWVVIAPNQVTRAVRQFKRRD